MRGPAGATGSTLDTFLGDQLPVELVASLDRVEADDATVVLHCRTRRYETRLQAYYGTVCETARHVGAGEPATVCLDVGADAVLRVRYARGGAVRESATPVVVGTWQPADGVRLEESASAVVVSGGGLTVLVERDPFRLTVRDTAGRDLWRTRPVEIPALLRTGWRDPAEDHWLFLHRYAYPLGSAVHGERRVAFVSVDLRHDEHVVGFGESFGPLDKRGTRQVLWLQEAFGNASPAAYKQVPFYVSSRGAGVLADTTNRVTVNVGSLEHTALSTIVEDTAELDIYVVGGPSPADVLPRYTALTGAPALPPRWTFGLWMSRMTYLSQQEVESTARDIRQHRIPCDVIHVDTGWFATDYVCDLRFSPERFPDPAGMVKTLRDLGFRVSLWQWPNLNIGSPLFQEAFERGFLVKRRSGQVYTYEGGYGQDAAFIDYSDPAAVAWIQAKFRDLLEMGVAAIKVDYGEGAPPDAGYVGVAPEAAHNAYPLLYQRAVWEASEQVHGTGEAVLWGRAGWAGSQRYPVHWSGDGVARVEDLACVLRATLSMGLSGFPFYAHDIGGFAGVPEPALYVRWAQLGLLSSHSRAHGSPPREPWHYGPAAEAAVRAMVEFRYRLLPYLWAEAEESARTSTPLVRPLLLDFPDDPTAWAVEDQYLLGRSLLVAPMLDGGTRRRVYLPAGRWVDHRSDEVLDGGRWLDVEAPLDEVPLFVRAGAVLPLVPLRQHVDEAVDGPLTLHLYAPAAEGGAVAIDGPARVRAAYARHGDEVVLTVDGAQRPVEAVVHAAPGVTVRVERRDPGR